MQFLLTEAKGLDDLRNRRLTVLDPDGGSSPEPAGPAERAAHLPAPHPHRDLAGGAWNGRRSTEDAALIKPP